MSRPSTATALLNSKDIRLDDEMSTKSKMTISPKPRDSKDDDFEIPAPPDVLKNAKHFVCPYCFFLCPISTRENDAWRSSFLLRYTYLTKTDTSREHIFQDLRPWVCTYVNCNESTQLYDRWKDWSIHEQSAHNRIWRCPHHPKDPFDSVQEFKEHWQQQQHLDGRTSLDDIAATCATTSNSPRRLCPICHCAKETVDDLQQHLATHLQRIAVFALPSLGDGSEDSTPGSAGAVQNSQQSSTNVSGRAQAGDGSLIADVKPTSRNDSKEELALKSSIPDLSQQRILPLNRLTKDSVSTLAVDYTGKEDVRSRILNFVHQSTSTEPELKNAEPVPLKVEPQAPAPRATTSKSTTSEATTLKAPVSKVPAPGAHNPYHLRARPKTMEIDQTSDQFSPPVVHLAKASTSDNVKGSPGALTTDALELKKNPSDEELRSDVATQADSVGRDHWLSIVFRKSRPTTHFATSGTEFVTSQLKQQF